MHFLSNTHKPRKIACSPNRISKPPTSRNWRGVNLLLASCAPDAHSFSDTPFLRLRYLGEPRLPHLSPSVMTGGSCHWFTVHSQCRELLYVFSPSPRPQAPTLQIRRAPHNVISPATIALVLPCKKSLLYHVLHVASLVNEREWSGFLTLEPLGRVVMISGW
jgi:hypothetical protein